ncbi:hypothetical protein BpHYR1_052683 [Brachionus plicatilis]|uniref:Uncharacterized protein n=1 Tax=Brachionus plicatilis TaxID=10195 RepID=A0A3M7Q4K6_BRAPC|nr:hypothetical protein BpHYR1_052683 [Brachionus plicatilis]
MYMDEDKNWICYQELIGRCTARRTPFEAFEIPGIFCIFWLLRESHFKFRKMFDRDSPTCQEYRHIVAFLLSNYFSSYKSLEISNN